MRAFLKTGVEMKSLGQGNLLSFLQDQLSKLELAPERGNLEASLYRLCKEHMKARRFVDGSKVADLLIRLTDVEENRQRYSLCYNRHHRWHLTGFRLQVRCYLGIGDVSSALRILNSMERKDLLLLAKIEVVLHDNQIGREAGTTKAGGPIHSLTLVALDSILKEFSRNKPCRESFLEAGRLLYAVFHAKALLRHSP